MSYEDGGMPAGSNSRFRGYSARVSERQQLALIMQMTSQEMTSGSSNRSESTIPLSNVRSSPLQHQKSGKSRWSNKNADLLDVNTSFNRQEDRLRLVNSCDKDRNEFAGSNSPDEVRTASEAESPLAAGSPGECAATATTPASSTGSAEQSAQQQQQPSQLHQPTSSSTLSSSSTSSSSVQQHQVQEEAPAEQQQTDPYEMRRTPPQNKVDRQVSGQQQQAASGAGGGAGGAGGSSSNSSSGTAGNGTSSSSSSSARVTLRLNQVRASRDEKKGTNASGTSATNTGNALSRQAAAVGSTSLNCNQAAMESSSGKSSSSNNASGSGSTGSASSSSGAASGASGPAGSGSNAPNSSTLSSTSTDGGDIYEFKSSKEATPVRGSSTSPNPNPEKDSKDATSSSLALSANSNQNQNSGSAAGSANTASQGSAGTVSSSTTSGSSVVSSTSASTTTGPSSTSTSGASSTSAEAHTASTTDEPMMTSASPQSSSASSVPSAGVKRPFVDTESTQSDEQDEEGRKRKKKDTEAGKDTTGAKGAASGRQAASRNNPNANDKNAKPGKQAGSVNSSKSNQGNNSTNNDRKSPSSSMSANSPKPSNSSSNTNINNPKSNTASATESDGEDDRKNSDCNSAPKVPPLKIVIPQSTTSEQEQGNRNGKSTSNRGHQLPYVVPSSNSNDSVDKEQCVSTGASGTTSPMDNNGAAAKVDEKKELSGPIDNESRSTHHQRVLRSSHRSGNGGNGSGGTRESSGNGNYSNSSPLPASTADRSNNSSPQRHHSPTPETSGTSEAGKAVSNDSSSQNSPSSKSNNAPDKCEKNVEVKKEPVDASEVNVKKEPGTETSNTSSQQSVELHPRKRKMKPNKENQQATTSADLKNETTETTSTGPEIHPHDQPITNCYQLFLNIRKQIDRRRKGLFPVQPKPPQGFKDYLMNRCTYVLAGNANKEPTINTPVNLQPQIKDLYIEQEKERYRLRMQHVVEKEKLVLSVEQEILRVHGRAARALANQSLPFSACTFLKDEEVYNVITPEQEEKDRNARSRYNGRLFLSWLQDVDDKWEKIKEGMLLRHHNEAESLHAVQRMDWEWKMKEVGLCEFKATPQIEDCHVPMVHVSDDFDLLPA